MKIKVYRLGLTYAALIFVIATVVSYIIRSDGAGMPDVADGVRRMGFPWLFWEYGGFEFRARLLAWPLIGNIVLATVLGLLTANIRKEK